MNRDEYRQYEESRRNRQIKNEQQINQAHDQARAAADGIDAESMTASLGITSRDEARQARNNQRISAEQFIALSRYFRQQR